MKSEFVAAAFLAVGTAASAGSVAGLFNTGVDTAGAVSSSGTAEIHYSLTGASSTVTVVRRHLSSANHTWVAAPPGSAWIGPADGPTGPVGNYSYTLRFDLTGFDPAAVELTGEFASDNTARICLNGNDAGHENRAKQYRELTPFSIARGFAAGLNTLEFRLTNGPPSRPNPTGLLVANLNLVGKPRPVSFAAAGPRDNFHSAQPVVFSTSPSAVLPRDSAFGHALPPEVDLTHWIESSPDLIHWSPVTNLTFYFKDADSTNHNALFYRFGEK